MANVKITSLTNLASADVDAADVFVIDDVSETQTKKITVANLRAAVDTIATSNINTVSSNVAAVEARRAANVTIFTNEDTALQARITANSTAFQNEDTALQSRLATNVTALTNEDTALQARITANSTAFQTEDTALQARITANNTLLHSNDFITFTRLNANLNVVQDNVAARNTQLNANLDVVQDNVASIISGATSFTGNVTLQTTNDGSTATPILILDRQSASPAAADYIGRVQFKGKDDGGGNETYAQISGKILDAAAGSEDGAIEIALRKAGTNTIVARQKSDKLQLLNGTELSVDGASDFTGEVTMNDDLIVTGNLTVNGTTTTINTTNMDVDDTMIMLANGTTGSPSNDIGILFNRGNQGNAAIFYDESAKTFKFSDTKDPTSNTSLSPVTASNINVGILDAATVKFDGADLSTAITDNVTTLTNEDTALQARITANNTLITELETRRTQNIAGGVSTINTSDLTVDRALISSDSGKVAVSAITATELGHLDGIDQNINSNLAALAAGIQGASVATFPTGDYGLLDTANTSTDSFGIAVGSLTTFDMKTEPSGSLGTEDLGALT